MDVSVLSTTTIDSTKDNDDFELKPPNKYFPTDTLKWMKVNATPQMSLKLMQVCKYFQHQTFPYFVIHSIHAYVNYNVYWDLKEKLNWWNEIEDIPSNLWITERILTDLLPNVRFIPQLISKIAVCEVKVLVLDYQEILMNDFKTLTSSGKVKKLHCDQAYIYEENSQIVSMESILGCLPNIVDIYFRCNAPSFSSIDAAKGWTLPNLKYVEHRFVNENFNAETFFEFMKEHKNIKFTLQFNDSISFQYAKQLQKFVDEIVVAGDVRYPPPKITFPFQTRKSKRALEALE